MVYSWSCFITCTCPAVLKQSLSPLRMHSFLKPSKREQLMELLAICVELDTAEELEMLLYDICGKQELVALAERWTIAKLLHMGFSYRNITKKTGSSAATIARMARLLMHGTGGLRDACLRREHTIIVKKLTLPSYQAVCRSLSASVG